MHQIYLAAAIIGGTVLVIQFALQLLGFGHDTVVTALDADGTSLSGMDPHTSHVLAGDPNIHTVAPLKILTLQTLAAFLAFFGLGALAGESAGHTEIVATGVGTLLGIGSMYFVAYLMRGLFLLQNDGTFPIDSVVGHTASVTVRIPGFEQGEGKIQVVVDGRLVEMGARTLGRPLANQEQARITRLLNPTTVEVQATDGDDLVEGSYSRQRHQS